MDGVDEEGEADVECCINTFCIAGSHTFSCRGIADRVIGMCILWQCGLLGMRIGEAAHPGPPECPTFDTSMTLAGAGHADCRVGQASNPGDVESKCPHCWVVMVKMRAGKDCYCSACAKRVDGRTQVHVCDPCGSSICDFCIAGIGAAASTPTTVNREHAFNDQGFDGEHALVQVFYSENALAGAGSQEFDVKAASDPETVNCEHAPNDQGLDGEKAFVQFVDCENALADAGSQHFYGQDALLETVPQQADDVERDQTSQLANVECQLHRWRPKAHDQCSNCEAYPYPKVAWKCRNCNAAYCSKACSAAQAHANRAAGIVCGDVPVEHLQENNGQPTQLEEYMAHTLMAQDTQLPSMSTKALLNIATSGPAMHTEDRLPPKLKARAARLMRDALNWHAQTHCQRIKHPGQAADELEEEASQWAWLTPALLKFTPDDCHQQEEQTERGGSAYRKRIQEYQRRIALAEMGEWLKLLQEYTTIYLDRTSKYSGGSGDPVGDNAWARELSEEEAERLAARKLDGAGLRSAKQILMGNRKVAATIETVEEVDNLVAVPTTDEEVEQQAKFIQSIRAKAAKFPPPKVRTIKAKLRTLQTAAEPGPSQWRNGDIIAIGREHQGMCTLQRWFAIWVRVQASPSTVRLWTAACIAPLEQGDRPTSPGEEAPEFPRNKLRSIGLCEALVKTAESCVIEEEISSILATLEPTQLGVGSPDAAAILIRLARAWAREIQQNGEWVQQHHDDADVICGIDLENAYGKVFRSTCLEGVEQYNVRIAAVAATEWSSESTSIWQYYPTVSPYSICLRNCDELLDPVRPRAELSRRR